MSTPKHYRLTRRGEIVRDVAIGTTTALCLVAIAAFGFGLMIGWWG